MSSNKNINSLIVMTGAVLVIFAIIFGYFFNQFVIDYGSKIERHNLLSRAMTAASSFNPASVSSLKGIPEDVNNPNFNDIRSQLIRIINANKDARFVYLMARKNDKIIFLADAEPPTSEDYSAPGDIYEDASEEPFKIFLDGEPYIEGPLKDKWGVWVSGHAPIIEPGTNKVIAIIGIDIDAQLWQKNINVYKWFGYSITGLIFMIVLLSFLAIYYISTVNKNLITEIEERQEAEKELEKYQERLEEIVEERTAELYESEGRFTRAVKGSSDGIWEWDIQSNSAWWSSRFCELLGYKENEIEATSEQFEELLHPEDKDQSLEAMQAHLEKRVKYDHVIRLRTKSGGYLWFRERGQAEWDETGSPLRISGSIMDITDIKLAEQELLVARDEAEQSSRAKSDFISNVSHELRTPMNAIIGMTHLALQGELTDKQHEYLNKVKLSSEALNNLIQGMLDFSDIDAGALTLANIEFELKQRVENQLAMARATATNKGLELKVFYDDDLPALLRGDPDRLSQILMSLLDNAIKYTEEGEITLHMKKIKDYQDKVLLEFSISDTGIGFKQSESDKLFQAFTQGDASSTRSVGGTGLGLALCKELVQIMGGEINAQSEPGKGSTFTFTAEFVQLTGQVITDITNDDAEYSVSSEKAISEAEGEISIDSSKLEPVLIELDHLLMEGDTEASEQLDRIEGCGCRRNRSAIDRGFRAAAARAAERASRWKLASARIHGRARRRLPRQPDHVETGRRAYLRLHRIEPAVAVRHQLHLLGVLGRVVRACVSDALP